MDEPKEALAFTCSLEGDQLVERIHAWQYVVREATDRRVEGDWAVISYPNDGRLLDQLRGLIRAEAACCSFLEFTLEQREDRIVTELRLPEEMPAPMKALILEVMTGDPVHPEAPGGHDEPG